MRSEAPLSGGSDRDRYWGLAATVVVVALYHLLFFNRYFPLSEGWFSAYGHLIRSGEVPYRDFYLFVTPLYPLKMAVVGLLFGDAFLPLRALGVLLVCGIAALTYLILAARFPPFAASTATIVSTIYYQSGVAHIGYDFIQFVTLYALLSAYCLVKLIRAAADGGRLDIHAAGTGFFASLAFLTKQSNGSFVVLFTFIALMLVGAALRLRILKAACWYGIGSATPVALVLLWLAVAGAIPDFIDQVLFGAVSAKGSLQTILFGWMKGLFTEVYWEHVKIVAARTLPFMAVSAAIYAIRRGKPFPFDDWWHKVWLIPLGAVFFGICILWPYFDPSQVGEAIYLGRELIKYVVVISTLTYAACFAALSVQAVYGRALPYLDICAVGAIGIGLVWGNGTSAGIGEVSTFLGFAIFASLLTALPNLYGAGAAWTLAFTSSFVIFLAGAKFARPYAWWALAEPDIRQAEIAPSTDLLTGFRLSRGSSEILDRTTRLIKQHTTTEDRVLAFPHMPFFYLAADRWPGGKAIVHWLDFLPDDRALSEANRILAAPPKIIVYLQMPEEVWTGHERLFRNGGRLGHRAIRETIEHLTREPNIYRLEESFNVPENCVLKIWRRVS